ncbi:MAG: hypothetical protein WCT37_00905 [Patescibacteria group bacterium]|jgi:hypothetical protein
MKIVEAKLGFRDLGFDHAVQLEENELSLTKKDTARVIGYAKANGAMAGGHVLVQLPNGEQHEIANYAQGMIDDLEELNQDLLERSYRCKPLAPILV